MKNESFYFLESNIIDMIISRLSRPAFNFKHLVLNISISHCNNYFNESLISLIITH